MLPPGMDAGSMTELLKTMAQLPANESDALFGAQFAKSCGMRDSAMSDQDLASVGSVLRLLQSQGSGHELEMIRGLVAGQNAGHSNSPTHAPVVCGKGASASSIHGHKNHAEWYAEKRKAAAAKGAEALSPPCAVCCAPAEFRCSQCTTTWYCGKPCARRL